jgi:hypothetical protein
MTYKVELSPNYDYCPQWWKQLCSKIYSSVSEDDLKDDLKDELLDDSIRSFIIENGGTIHLDEDCDIIEYIEFNSEAHFHWFLFKI